MTADSSAQQRLLIVEDDEHMAYLLGYLAEKERFAVESISDGRWLTSSSQVRGTK